MNSGAAASSRMSARHQYGSTIRAKPKPKKISRGK